jgi:hypothetical protein
MRLTKTNVVAIYGGLKEQKLFLHNIMAGMASTDAADVSRAIEKNIQIDKIRKVLEIIETGLAYFEQHWLDAAGVPKKFQWWSIPQWKLMFKSIDFYGDMFADIADVYKSDVVNQGYY